MATNLSVNLNAIAMLRNRRNLAWPRVTHIGELALQAGAHGLTVHPRPDERHIRKTDVYDLAALLKQNWTDREFNIEGFPDERLLTLVKDVKPHQVTLVPDDPQQNTSDHGWDIGANEALLKEVIEDLKRHGLRVSLFIDADPLVAKLASSVGADRVEIYTGPYGSLEDDDQREVEIELIGRTVEVALDVGLTVNAGHDLTLVNLPALIKRVPSIAECSIGHCFTSDCLIYGVEQTTQLYLKALGHDF